MNKILNKKELSIEFFKNTPNINKDFLNFLINNKADLETMYLCLFHLQKPQDYDENFADLNLYFDCIKKISILTFDTSFGNSHEDYRNLIIILSENYKVIITLLYIRLYSMEKLKKIEFSNKKQYGYDTLNIYAPLAHRLGIGHIKSQLEELSLYFINLDAFKNIVKKLEAKKNIRQEKVNKNIELIKEHLDIENYVIFGRSKSIYSIYKKIYSNNKEFEDIYDFQGIRIICNTKDECYSILSTIHELFEPIPHRFKDYILLKKPNLYQSIHTSIKDGNGEIYEVQIRTFEMDEIAERGIAAHWLYKENKAKKSKNNDIEESLHLLREVIKGNNDGDNKFSNIFNDVIYTYTPNNKIIILHKNATIIDFAYRIHTNVAQSMVSAIVNNKIVPFSYNLQNGDIIKILTKTNFSAVQKEWLDICHTAHAKKKIKSFINKQKSSFYLEDVNQGKKMIENLIKNNRIKANIINDVDIQNKLLRELTYKNIDKLYVDFYLGKISTSKLNKAIEKEEEEIFVKKNKKNTPISKNNNYDILIPGIDTIKLMFSRCCHPVYGDEIVGVIRTGKGISIHKKDCSNIVYSKSMNLEWGENNNKYEAILLVETTYTIKILNEMIATLSKEKIVVKEANYKMKDKVVKINLEIEVKNLEQLKNLINTLKNVGENTHVIRK